VYFWVTESLQGRLQVDWRILSVELTRGSSSSVSEVPPTLSISLRTSVCVRIPSRGIDLSWRHAPFGTACMLVTTSPFPPATRVLWSLLRPPKLDPRLIEYGSPLHASVRSHSPQRVFASEDISSSWWVTQCRTRTENITVIRSVSHVNMSRYQKSNKIEMITYCHNCKPQNRSIRALFPSK